MTINILAVLAGIMCMSVGSTEIRTSTGDWDLFLACLWASAGIMLVRGGIHMEDPR
jgi:hypothetical protein